jgi:adenine-specific DNA-methyltransferase
LLSINSKGTGRANEFRRVDEYVYFLWFGSAKLGRLSTSRGDGEADDSLQVELEWDAAEEESEEEEEQDGEQEGKGDEDSENDVKIGLDWQTFRRRDLASKRGTKKGGPRQFYPIYVDAETGRIVAVGDPLPHDVPRTAAPQKDGCVAVFPIRPDGTEMNWATVATTFVQRWKAGYARAGRATPNQPQQYIIQYLKAGPIKDIEEGRAVVTGRSEDGSVVAEYPGVLIKTPTTQWAFKSHNAEHYGTGLLTALLPDRYFPFPKSLYAVEDCLRIFIAEKKDALVLDFFAGSGTTAHARTQQNTWRSRAAVS